MLEKRFTLDRIVRVAIAFGIFVALLKALQYLSDALIPFAMALLLAYLLNPLVELIQRKINNRAASVAITLVLVGIILTTALSIIIPAALGEIAEISVSIKQVAAGKLAEGNDAILTPELRKQISEWAASDEVQAWVSSDKIGPIVTATARKVLPGAWSILSGITGMILSLVGLTVIMLYLIFLLIDFESVRKNWQNVLPPQSRKPIMEFITNFTDGMRRYFRGQATVASIVGVLLAAGFGIIGLPLGVVLGLFIGLLNMVPYLQIVGMIPVAILALLYPLIEGGHWWGMPLKASIVFALVQILQDTVLTPRILGKATGLRPWMILLSLSIWGKLLGLLGMLIALPMTCLVWAYYQRLISTGPETIETHKLPGPSHKTTAPPKTAPPKKTPPKRRRKK